MNAPYGECYRSLTNMLRENSYSRHSYQNKQNRPVEVVVKYLPHECNNEKIAKELGKRIYKLIEAINKLKWKTNEPMDIFLLVFSHDEDVDKIYANKDILGI